MKKVFAFTLLLSTVLVVYSCQQQHINTLPASIFITNAPSGYRTVNAINQTAPESYTTASPLVRFTAYKSRYVTRLCWRRYTTSNRIILCAETSQRLLGMHTTQQPFIQQNKTLSSRAQ